MEIFFATLQAVLFLLGFGIIGFWIIAKRIVPEKILEVLSPLIIDIALPCLVFTNIVMNFNPASLPDWWMLPLWWIGFFAVLSVLTLFFILVTKDKNKSETGMCLVFPNAIFFPLAIIPGIFEEHSAILTQLFIFVLFYPSLLFNTYHFFYKTRKKENKAKLDLEKFFNPVLLATIVAVLIVITDIKEYLPELVTSITGRIGSMSLPLIMIMIGGNVYIDFQNKGEIYFGKIAKFLLLKHLLFPTVIMIILLILKPPVTISFLIFLQAILPPVTAVSILADRAKGDVAFTNQLLVSSFIFSIISVPVSLTIYNYFLPMP